MSDSGARDGEKPLETLQDDGVQGGFAHAVATLAMGDLLFPWPFDLATSAALMRNGDIGGFDAVRRLFDAAQPGSEYQIQITVHECVEGADLPPREVIDTVAHPDAAIVLLAGFIHEVLQRRVR